MALTDNDITEDNGKNNVANLPLSSERRLPTRRLADRGTETDDIRSWLTAK